MGNRPSIHRELAEKSPLSNVALELGAWNAARPSSTLILLAALLAFFTTPVTASLPQGPWLDLLELRADQAMEAGDYAEVMRVADLYRQAGGEPGIQLRAQEIVAGARHAGNPGSAFVPSGRLIVEAGP